MYPQDAYTRKINEQDIVSRPIPRNDFAIADPGKRVISWLIDIGVIYVSAFISGVILYASNPNVNDDTVNTASFCIVLLFVPLCEWRWGKTAGKKILGIRTVDLYTGERISFGQAIGRHGMRLIDGFFFAIPAFISMSRSEMNQRLGDRQAHTVVVDDR
ncbi:MAG: RDD family protein [Thermomicrobiales bacterium]